MKCCVQITQLSSLITDACKSTNGLQAFPFFAFLLFRLCRHCKNCHNLSGHEVTRKEGDRSWKFRRRPRRSLSLIHFRFHQTKIHSITVSSNGVLQSISPPSFVTRTGHSSLIPQTPGTLMARNATSTTFSSRTTSRNSSLLTIAGYHS